MYNGGYPIQSWPGEGTLSSPGTPSIQSWDWVPPCPDLGWGTPPPNWTWDGVLPHPDLGWGTPLPISWIGYYPQTGPGVSPPSVGWGNPQPGMGHSPPVQTWDGVPPLPPSRCGLSNKLKTVPFPILRMRTVNKYNLSRTSSEIRSSGK